MPLASVTGQETPKTASTLDDVITGPKAHCQRIENTKYGGSKWYPRDIVAWEELGHWTTNCASVTEDVALNIDSVSYKRRIEGDVVSFIGRCAHVTFAKKPCWVIVKDTGNPLGGRLGKCSISVLTGRLLPVAERSMLYISP